MVARMVTTVRATSLHPLPCAAATGVVTDACERGGRRGSAARPPTRTAVQTCRGVSLREGGLDRVTCDLHGHAGVRMRPSACAA